MTVGNKRIGSRPIPQGEPVQAFARMGHGLPRVIHRQKPKHEQELHWVRRSAGPL